MSRVSQKLLLRKQMSERASEGRLEAKCCCLGNLNTLKDNMYSIKVVQYNKTLPVIQNSERCRPWIVP